MADYSNIAIQYADENFSLSEAKKILKGNDDIIKSAVILNLKELDKDLAELLIYNLTNQSGPVRELCAYKINELIKDYNLYFQSKETLDVIVAAINDVNPNVVRFVIQSLNYFDDKKYIFDKLILKIKKLNEEIINKPRRGKAEEHIFTKKCFKIYWSLEALKFLISAESNLITDSSEIRENFYNIVSDLSDCEEYTIREKIAQIVNLLPDSELYDIKIKLSNDSNYFVKRQYKEV